MSDIQAALQAAERGWNIWKNTNAWTRSDILRNVSQWIKANGEIIAKTLTEEQGKPLSEARGEVKASVDQYDWYADEARRIYGRTIEGHNLNERLMVIHQSVGPVAAFSPWNFPLYLASRKIAPAIAAGCSVILKPGLEAPRSALFIAQAFEQANLPPGVLNIITGNHAIISDQLCQSNIIRKITLTGSIPVGSLLLRQSADTIKEVTMELGGHSPFIVFDDVDVPKVAEMAAKFKYRNNGQVCIAPSRFYVHKSIEDEFVKQFIKTTQQFKQGNGLDPEVDMGPLANIRRVKMTESLIQDALEKGAQLKLGGKRSLQFHKGFFFEPTVLTNVNPTMKIMHEEPFCPVAPLTSFTEFDEVIALANSTDYGLAAYVFTRDMKRAILASEKIEAGMVGINEVFLATVEGPFGGIKKSGFGREGGSEGIFDYLTTKFIKMKI
jgi:succinate-semialdehyde dehydrogenase/glutarate-semialdehyde dehydrogenase